MKRSLTLGAAAVLAVAGTAVMAPPASAATPPSYSVMFLAPLHDSGRAGEGIDGQHTWAEGLNNRGDVVGTSLNGLAVDATLWKSRSGQPTEVAIGSWDSIAADVSGNGTIVGTDVSLGSSTGFWQAGATVSSVGDGLGQVSLYGVSDGGVAIMTVLKSEATPQLDSYVVTSPTSLTELPHATGTAHSSVAAISDNGRRIAGHGSAQADGPQNTPVLWTDGTPSALQIPSGTSSAWGRGVNDAGTVVGCAQRVGSQAAYSWAPGGTATALAGLSGYSSCAEAINNASAIAGTSTNTGGSVATVWHGGVAHDLNKLVAEKGGFTLQSVADINSSGQVVGTAKLANGNTRGFIATPSTAVNLYTTPGLHHFNGRQWKTACSPYSQTTRCRTEIWSTQVRVVNGKYTQYSGWNFNNLTYVASPKSLWTGNPLATSGEWTSNGRRWMTECNTPATGRNGCRSYIWSQIISSTPLGNGQYRYSTTDGWVFNNIVHFS